MAYYLTDGKKILKRLEHVSPNPPTLHSNVLFFPFVEGKEACIMSDDGALFFVLQKNIAVINTEQGMLGVVTQVGSANLTLVRQAIEAFLSNEHD